MKFLFFITYKSVNKSNGVAEKVALVTVSFAIIAIIVSMSIASGFRNELTNLILQKEGDLWLECRDSSMLSKKALPVDSDLIRKLYDCNVTKVEPRLSSPVVIVGDDEALSVEIRTSKDVSSNGITISSQLASKLSVKAGDTLNVMYSINFPFSFPVKVDSLYDCGLKELSESICYASFSTVANFKGIDIDNVDGYVLWGGDVELISNLIYPRQIWMYDSRDRFSGIFDWLDVIDGNVWLVVIIMIVVATINMLAGSLSIILENTKTIAILKSIGMPSSSIRFGLLLKNFKISLSGALIGFIIAFTFCIFQYLTHFVTLPSSDYLVTFVPIQIDFLLDIVATFLSVTIISIITFLVTLVIDSIKEDKILRYE